MRRIGRHAAAGNRERHGAVAVRFGAQRRRMVGRDQDPIVALRLQRRVQRADDVPVDFLQGFDFRRGVAFVRGLVGRLDVDADDIGIRECLDRVAPLAA